MLVSADGMHYTDADGRQVLDGCAGLWCVNAGHNRRPIVEAIQRQAAILDHAPPFQMGHPVEFRSRRGAGGDGAQGFVQGVFAAPAPEAADTALKIALATTARAAAPPASS